MISFKEALKLISNLSKVCSLHDEWIDVEEADGRICSQQILSPERVPPFDNSAMDGFAVRFKDTLEASSQNPISFAVSHIIAAGDDISSHQSTPDFSSMEIMTGAAVPPIYDAVIKIEDVEVVRDEKGGAKKIIIKSPAYAFNNIRRQGSDYQDGQIVLQRGSLIRPESLMALASLGISKIPVFSKPAVAILSTGKELVPLQTKNLAPGMIRNSTSLYLKTALTHLGAQVVDVQTMGDEVSDFKNYVQKILSQDINILVTTGAVSMGVYDFIVPALLEMQAEIIFHKVAIRPGKPILLATLSRPSKKSAPLVIFGMPGNPVSTAVGLRFFLTPFIREINSRGVEQGVPLKLTQTISKPAGLQCFYKARLEKTENGLQANPLLGQASFMVSSLVDANAWVLFSQEGKQVTKDENVLVYPLLPDQSFDGAVL
jgi:molybdopterin molybdotransferase